MSQQRSLSPQVILIYFDIHIIINILLSYHILVILFVYITINGLCFGKMGLHTSLLRINPFQNRPHVCSTSLFKTLQEMEKLLLTSNFSLKLLLTSNFSFSRSAFFYQFEELSSIFTEFEIVICKLLLFG